ncbi:hypothetical protein [Loktanella sp. M215]|uniref:hypothetical protein n=1 Tax=Loktanella sp. M215 TaxID=2675431 RepID=UPI001F476712|nr:hypothetical protein [Loktanella sp. M215]MCF7702522.1 hypothetical protein [Loktanella sp. M215]
MSRELYNEYDVTKHGGHGDFIFRLARWIGSAETDDDQKSLFVLLRHLIFFGDNELDAAYRTAFSRHVVSWLMNDQKLNVFSTTADADLKINIK